MSEDLPKDIKEGFPLKALDPQILPKKPWAEDALGRGKVANTLTNIVSGHKDPLVISLDGYWGTGKTFLLKRWQVELHNQGFKSIYFNAWEDDFCDDPLVAIIGQLSETFIKGNFEEIVTQIKNAAGPLFKQSLLSIANKATGGVLTDEFLKELTDSTLKEYSSQRKNKDKLKKHLQEMSDEVMEDTKQPLVFIIDELDRCRPTFAIELLERVKHIFDIPGMVFVFGINRKELCSSIESVYGKIDAGVYLRRFFDLNLSLPDANVVNFCRYLIDKKYRLKRAIKNNVDNEKFNYFSEYGPLFYNQLGLSLRDLDYCIRSVFFVAKNIRENYYMYPYLIGTLIALRLENPSLYQKFIKGKCLGSEVMDYIDEQIPDVKRVNFLDNTLLMIEAELYRTDNKALDALSEVASGHLKPPSKYLSKRTRGNVQRAQELLSVCGPRYVQIDISYIYSLIELTQAE